MTKKIRHTLTIVDLVTILFVLGLSGHGYCDRDYALAKLSEPIADTGPIMTDPGLKVEMIFRGIDFPTSMAFLDENDILVLEKNEGTVRRIVDGVMLENPLLNVNVSTEAERGLLGIAVAKNENSRQQVYLYFTEALVNNSEVTMDEDEDEPSPSRNRLYRYDMTDNRLTNPVLILDLPAEPRTIHNGGALLIHNGDVYVTVGDMFGTNPQENEFPDGRGGILRIDERGLAVQGRVGNEPPLDLYYAYGIRNSFGMDFDPLTGELWDTENGPGYGDEVNLVRPGFNSGWASVQGVWEGKSPDSDDIVLDPDSDDLIDFDGRLEYSAPELAVYPSIGFTALAFLDSNKYGQEYENDILAGDFHNGHLYDLDLNAERTGLEFNGQLDDSVANDMEELDELVLGQGFGGIIDIEIGPDGYIYVLSLYQGGWNCEPDRPEITRCIEYSSSMEGTIFRIVPTNNSSSAPDERQHQTTPST